MTQPQVIRAADVREGDIMNFVAQPRSYDQVIRVTRTGDDVRIDWFTIAHSYYTVKHAEEGVAVWRGAV